MKQGQEPFNYKDTLNLPSTEFSMKANLSTRELNRIEYWKSINLYEKMIQKNKNNQHFLLHDGPPYANGHIHLGHAVNKILKDIVVKYNHMQGKLAPFILGWDCHGLPIEIQVMKKVNKKDVTRNKIRQLCREHAQKFIGIQKEGFERLLVISDPDHYYSTMSFDFEADILEMFFKATKEQYVYRGVKPVHWCPSCATALADAEIEYQDQESSSIYVEFPLSEVRSVLIWTTTPWSLPSNVALAFNDQIEYVVVKESSSHKEYIVAKEMVGLIVKDTQKELSIVSHMSIEEIKQLKAKHPLFERDSKIVFGEHVVLGSGTGVVHTAPGHGVEDFALVKPYNLDVIMPIDDYGRFTKDVAQWEGKHIKEANPLIIEELENKGKLFYCGKIKHSYPHCWRCKNSLMIRATGQFFIDIHANGLQEKLIHSVKEDLSFISETQRQRMLNVVTGRPDWCISRQRVWGVPIPSLQCKKCDHVFLNEQVIEQVGVRTRTEGLDFWFSDTQSVKEQFPFVKECPHCKEGVENLVKGEDILDVWFDSGTSAYHIVKMLKEQSIDVEKLDLYIEGMDQFRAWFQTSLIVGMMNNQTSPYKALLTHGSVLDEKGMAMSKSMGNVVAPSDMIKTFGADILRLWVVSQDYLQDMRSGEGPFKQVSDAYRKIRNTFRFLLSNLYDFTQKDHEQVKEEDYADFDKWALHKLTQVSLQVHSAYEKQNLTEVFKLIFHFMNLDLSSFYLDLLKDRLYTLKKDSKERRSSQKVIFTLVEHLVHLLVPILSFTAEEVYEHLPFTTGSSKLESLFLSDYGTLAHQQFEHKAIYEKVELIRIVRDEVLKATELARQRKFIGSNLDVFALVAAPTQEIYDLLKQEEAALPTYFILSSVMVDYRNRSSFKEFGYTESTHEKIKGLKVYIYKAPGSKCPRCWKYSIKDDDSLCNECSNAVHGKAKERV